RRPREKRVHAAERILTAHLHLVAALRHWIGTGGLITLVLGNHDQPAVDPDVHSLLAEILPGLNSLTGGGPTHCFADEAAGLYAEHGHQWDPLNRLRALNKPDADCPGRRVVRYLVNNLEPLMPLIDKGADLRDL